MLAFRDSQKVSCLFVCLLEVCVFISQSSVAIAVYEVEQLNLQTLPAYYIHRPLIKYSNHKQTKSSFTIILIHMYIINTYSVIYHYLKQAHWLKYMNHRNVQKVKMYKNIHFFTLRNIYTRRNSFKKYRVETSLHTDAVQIRTCRDAHM